MKTPRIGAVLAHPDPVAEQRAAAERAGRIDGEHRHPGARGRGTGRSARWSGSTCPLPADRSARPSPPRVAGRRSAAATVGRAAAARLDPAEQPGDRAHRPPAADSDAVRRRSRPADGSRTCPRLPGATVGDALAEPSAIDHVGIAVPDLAAAIAFHTEVLGGVLAHRETQRRTGGRGGDDHLRRRRPQVQLLAPLRPESTIAKFLDRNGPGLQQLAYRVDDVRAAAEAGQSRRRSGPCTTSRAAARPVVDQFPAPQGRRRGAGRAGGTGRSARPRHDAHRRCVRGVGTRRVGR